MLFCALLPRSIFLPLRLFLILILAAQKVTSDGIVRSFPLINPLIRSTGADTASYLNYDVGAQYKLNDDVMVYATYARAQQGPIYDAEDNVTSNGPTPALNTTGLGGRLKPLSQEKVTSFEAGIKSQLFDRRLTLNVSLFQSTFDNYQVLTNLLNPDPNLPPTLKVESVGTVRTRGVEANVAGRLTDNLRANLNVAYTEAKILDFPNAPCYSGAVVGGPDCTTINPGTSRAFNTQGNLGGSLLNRAPRLRFTYSMDYGLPIGSGESEFFFAPLIKYASSQRTDLLKLPSSVQGNSVIVDANIGIRNPRFTAELFVRNLFEDSIETFGITATGFVPNNVVVNRQLDRNNFRHVGARFRYNF
jgi:iron complex outermembrane receptor protein